jgi:nitroreductase
MIAAMPVLEAIGSRRAVRAYTDQPVPADTIHALLHAAVEAPTAMHVEPWVFLVIQDRALLARISDRAKRILAARTDHDGLVRSASGPIVALPPELNIFYDAGTLIVICARAHGPFATADCWLAAQNLMLAACALGYATCPIGFAVPALNAPIIVGVARETPHRQPRREPEILAWR